METLEEISYTKHIESRYFQLVNEAINIPSCSESGLKMLVRPLFWALFWLPYLCPIGGQ
jgi:hypothetical protein